MGRSIVTTTYNEIVTRLYLILVIYALAGVVLTLYGLWNRRAALEHRATNTAPDEPIPQDA